MKTRQRNRKKPLRLSNHGQFASHSMAHQPTIAEESWTPMLDDYCAQETSGDLSRFARGSSVKHINRGAMDSDDLKLHVSNVQCLSVNWETDITESSYRLILSIPCPILASSLSCPWHGQTSGQVPSRGMTGSGHYRHDRCSSLWRKAVAESRPWRQRSGSGIDLAP